MQNYENCSKKTKKKNGYHSSNNISKNNVNIKDIKTLYNIFSCNIQTESNIIDCTDKINKDGSIFLTKMGKNINGSDNNNKESHDNYKITKTGNVKKEDDLFLRQTNKQKPKDNDFDFFMEYNENNHVNKLTKIKHLDKNKKETNINSTINSYQSNHDSLLYLNEIDDIKNFEKNYKNSENTKYENILKNTNTEVNNDVMHTHEQIVHYNYFDENYNKIEKIKEPKEKDITINKINDVFIVGSENQNIEWEKRYEPFEKELEKNISSEQNNQDILNTSILFDNIFYENKKNNCTDFDFRNKSCTKNETDIVDKISDHIDLDTYPNKEIINYDINFMENEKNTKDISFPFDFNSNIFPKTNFKECIYNSLVFDDKDSDIFNIKDKNILDGNIDKKKEVIHSSDDLIKSDILFNFYDKIQFNKYDEMFEKEEEQRNNDILFKDVKKSENNFFLSEYLNKSSGSYDKLYLNKNNKNEINYIIVLIM